MKGPWLCRLYLNSRPVQIGQRPELWQVADTDGWRSSSLSWCSVLPTKPESRRSIRGEESLLKVVQSIGRSRPRVHRGHYTRGLGGRQTGRALLQLRPSTRAMGRENSVAWSGGGHILCLPTTVPSWRNWQTRWTQNPVVLKHRVGSIPSDGTNFLVFSQQTLSSNTANSGGNAAVLGENVQQKSRIRRVVGQSGPWPRGKRTPAARLQTGKVAIKFAEGSIFQLKRAV